MLVIELCLKNWDSTLITGGLISAGIHRTWDLRTTSDRLLITSDYHLTTSGNSEVLLNPWWTEWCTFRRPSPILLRRMVTSFVVLHMTNSRLIKEQRGHEHVAIKNFPTCSTPETGDAQHGWSCNCSKKGRNVSICKLSVWCAFCISPTHPSEHCGAYNTHAQRISMVNYLHLWVWSPLFLRTK